MEYVACYYFNLEEFFSVLEQFNITKYNLFANLLKIFEPLIILLPLVYINPVYIIPKRNLKYFVGIREGFFSFLRRFFGLFISLYKPTPNNTKNVFFGRFVNLAIKSIFKIFVRKKIMVYWRTNTQLFKIKLQVGIQEGVKSNFGTIYPFKERLYVFYPFILSVFLLIALHNLNGLLFYGFTNTAFLLQNFVYSYQIVVGLTLLGIGVRSYHFYKMFVPSNVPLILLPFLVVIEVISHIAKIFSLAIRLFANMMSGHVLLHILTGFFLEISKKNYLFIIFPTLLIMSIVLLEYGITFLQAYVFVTLMAIYFEEHFSFSKVDALKVYNTQYIKGIIKASLEHDQFYYINYKTIPSYKELLLVYITSYRRRQKKKHNLRKHFNIFSYLIAV